MSELKKKLLFTLLIFAFLQSFSFAEIMSSRFKITESEEEFDVIYYVSEDLKAGTVVQNEDVAVTQTFNLDKDGVQAEIRYSLFTDCGGDESYLMVDYAMWVFMCASNALGFEVGGNSFSQFNPSDVKQEFNGDFGCSGFFMDPVSDYGSGYKYVMMEFFYKKGQGLVMRSFLFNDMSFIGITPEGMISPDSVWLQNYHTFAFMDKEEK